MLYYIRSKRPKTWYIWYRCRKWRRPAKLAVPDRKCDLVQGAPIGPGTEVLRYWGTAC